MTNVTNLHVKLNDHIYHGKGYKTVCVSTCLDFFGIPFDGYSYTSSDKNMMAYKNVLRRFGWSVRSRKSEFKSMKYPTLSKLRSTMKKSDYCDDQYFLVKVFQSRSAHLIVLNGNGETVIDTAPKKRWRVADVCIVESL